jgi:Ca-activated chloride channel family protein
MQGIHLFACGVLYLLLSGSAFSQQVTISPQAVGRRPVPPEPATFTGDSRLVLLPTSVVDHHGTPLLGLRAENFSVVEDGKRYAVTSLGEEDGPISVGIVLDASKSMSPWLDEAKEALRAFLSVSNPEDEAFLFMVSTKPEVTSRFTGDIGSLSSRAVFVNAAGDTALVDTTYAALLRMREARWSRKAIVVISDGMDNHSRYSQAELLRLASESDTQICSLSIYDPELSKGVEFAEASGGIHLLQELTRRAGGMSIMARYHGELKKDAARLAGDLRTQYLIGFTPVSPADAKWHPIRVELNGTPGKAYSRSGFYSK